MAAQIQRDRHDTHRSAPPVASGPSGKISAARGPWRGQHTYLLARRDSARARSTAAHNQKCRKGDCARVKGKGTWQPKYNGIGTTLIVPRRPLRRGRAGRFQLPGGPGEAKGTVREANMQEDTYRTLPCKARLAHSCARMFGKLGKPRVALKAP